MAGRALCALCTEPAAATALVSGADCLPHQEDCLPHQADCLPHQADCLPLQADCLPHPVSGPTPPLLTILHSLPAVLGTPPFLSDGALGALHAALASSVREAARHAPGTALGAAPGEATEQTLRALTTALLAYADGRWEALTTTLHGALRATDGGMGGGGLGGGGMGSGSGAAAAAAALPNMAKEAASVFRLYRYVIVQLGGRRLLSRLMTMLPAIRAMVDAVTAEQARLYVASGAVLGYAHVTGTKEARALRTARTEALRLLIACVHHFDAPPPPSTASSTPSTASSTPSTASSTPLTAWSAADAAADAAAGGSGGRGGGGSGGGGGGARVFTALDSGARAFTALDSAETEAVAAAVLHRLPRSSGERELHQS